MTYFTGHILAARRERLYHTYRSDHREPLFQLELRAAQSMSSVRPREAGGGRHCKHSHLRGSKTQLEYLGQRE